MLGLEYVSAHPEHILGYIHLDGLVSLPMTQDAIFDNTEAKFKADAAREEEGQRRSAQRTS